MKAAILTVGDEILIGQIVDTNSAWIGQQLNLIGAEVVQITSVGDDYTDIQRELQIALDQADVVLLTGGLGPTKDDITKKALADFFGVALVFHDPTYARIRKLFERWGRKTTEAHRLQAYTPANAELLHNKMGTAPGMYFQHGEKIVVSMPGVPYEMKYLMENEVIPRLRATFPSSPIAHRTILTVGEGESAIAERIAEYEARLPRHIKLAYLPNLGVVRLRLSGRGSEAKQLEAELDAKALELSDQLHDIVFGREKIRLEEAVGNMLQERGLTLGTAESCTGGYVAHRITTIAGSSAYFMGSVVTYSNALKERLLGVKPETLQTYGAVSEATVREMATGALELLATDLAVAISGIAGPGGGTPEKPVGTIWMAVVDGERTETFLLRAGKDREKNIQFAGVHALNQVRKFVLMHYPKIMV